MATDNLQAGSAPANDLPHALDKQADETSQQFADRLLKAHRNGANLGPPAKPDWTSNRPAFGTDQWAAWEAAKADYQQVNADHDRLFAFLGNPDWPMVPDRDEDAERLANLHIPVFQAAADRCCATPAPDLAAVLFKMEGPMMDSEERRALCVSEFRRLQDRQLAPAMIRDPSADEQQKALEAVSDMIEEIWGGLALAVEEHSTDDTARRATVRAILRIADSARGEVDIALGVSTRG